MQPLGEYVPGVDEQAYGTAPLAPAQWTGTQERPYVPPNLPTAPPETPPIPTAPSRSGPVPAVLAPAPTGTRVSAGVGILLVGVAAAGGAYLGGAYGAGAGLLLMGGARNVVRASKLWSAPDALARDEAVKSGTMALFGLGIGSWLAYKAYEARKGSDE